MSEVTRLIVVRHGNTFNSGDVILRVGSATDIPLTEKGVMQGNAVGRDLAAAGIPVDVIFSAPLLRTVRSAQEIASHYGNLPVQTAEFLTELNYGMDDGQPEDDIVLRLGIVESNGRITPETSLDELRAAGKAALKKWDSEAVLPLAWGHLAARASQLEKDWAVFGEKVKSEFAGKTVVAVTSNGIARFSKVLLEDGGASLGGNLKLATGAYGVYVFENGKWRCDSWNMRPEL
ncbi:MAG: histidine phosphatase family protein [Lentisphaerae bacterium]|nr:histidine phosphatase family protein [Lentisphaerota bacterium]